MYVIFLQKLLLDKSLSLINRMVMHILIDQNKNTVTPTFHLDFGLHVGTNE